MFCSEINIRDPYILCENGKYYLYGTRAANFGRQTRGFDVYISDDLVNWSDPKECFNSDNFGLNTQVNWAPEVHKYKGSYYMFASFTQDCGLRGTYILKSESPEGPFIPHGNGAITPEGWECIDGTFYVENEKPYLVFVHEHTQILDGTICYIELNENLTETVGEPVTLFAATDPVWAEKRNGDSHHVTDGPFMYRTNNGTLLMIWSTFIKGLYAECAVRFNEGTITGKFEHLDPIIDNDGGHGMIFKADNQLYLTYHSPNKTGSERVFLQKIKDEGDTISIIK